MKRSPSAVRKLTKHGTGGGRRCVRVDDSQWIEMHLNTVVEDALTAINDDSEHRIYRNGERQVYDVMDETPIPADRSVLIERRSDDKRFRVYFTVHVEEANA